MKDKHDQKVEETTPTGNNQDMNHSMVCNESLFFTGLRAAAEDTDREEFGEEK